MKKPIIITSAVAVTVVLITVGVIFIPQWMNPPSDTELPYPWPTFEWKTSDPEDQGMDSELLNEIDSMIADNFLDIDSITVIRNGYLVYEKYYENYIPRTENNYTDGAAMVWTGTNMHQLHSATKSIVSLLIGIAIDNEFLESVNQTFFDICPEYWKPSYNESKLNITIEHILTQTSGLPWDVLSRMLGHEPPVNYIEAVLDQELLDEPGESYSYSSDATQLLSAIINETTGMKLSEFAEQYLFEPIGISSEGWYWDEGPVGDSSEGWFWEEDYEGFSYGGTGIYMSPRNMAKIGLLCSNEGNWNGTQVVSSEWIEESVTVHVQSQYLGYLWWLNWEEPFIYRASGFRGQMIYVIPDLDIVVTINSVEPDTSMYSSLIKNVIIASTV